MKLRGSFASSLCPNHVGDGFRSKGEILAARIEIHTHLSHNQNPALKWSTQNHASRIKTAEIRSYLWQGDCPLLTPYSKYPLSQGIL